MFFPNDITHLRFTRSADLDPRPSFAPSRSGKGAQSAEIATV
jgi:hypothetical protein